MEAGALLKFAKTFAVIGLSENPEKYSYKIYQRLILCGYTTYGISPFLKELDGSKVYSSLKEVPAPIDVAVFVVSPKNGYQYLEECKKLGIKYLWMQPGTYDEAMLQALEQSGLSYYLDCILRKTDSPEKAA